MKKMIKTKLLAVFGAVSVLALLSTGTLAYFTTQAEVENHLTTGAVLLQVRQRDAFGKEISGKGTEIMPGDTVVYSASVENTGEEPVWLRVKLTENVEGAGVSENGVPDAKACLEIVVNDVDWTWREETSGEGYYYYNRVLQGGEETEPLFTEVHFRGSAIDNDYLGKSFAVHVAAYGVQSANNGESVLDAFGWPEEADTVR